MARVWLCTCGHEQIYCGPQDSDGSPGSVILCDAEDTYFYSLYNSTIKRLGGGYFMTEFGAMANNSRGIDNMRYLIGQADRHLSSWTYWQFKGTLAPVVFAADVISALINVSYLAKATTTSPRRRSPRPNRSTMPRASWRSTR